MNGNGNGNILLLILMLTLMLLQRWNDQWFDRWCLMTVMVVANGNVGPLNFLLLMVVVQWTSLALTCEIVQFTLVGGLVYVVHHFLIFIIVCVIVTIIIKTVFVFGGVFVGHESRHVRFVLEWASVTKLLERVEKFDCESKEGLCLSYCFV